MKFVVTGATSFIGLELIDLLLKQEHSVVAVCRSGSKGLASLPSNVETVFSDMSGYDCLSEKIRKADAFVNLAWGGTGHDGRDMHDIQIDNVKYSAAAMKSAAKMGCMLFLEAGSQAEYGSTSEPQEESGECLPFSEYGKAKLKMKETGFELSEQLNIKYIHLRIFSLFGENDHPWTLVMSAVRKMLSNEPVDLSPCTQNWNFLYVKDAVQMIVKLCMNAVGNNSFKHEVYNIASNDTRPLKDFVNEMKDLAHSDSVLNYGALNPQNLVSLQPDIRKTVKASRFRDFHKFSDVIKKIVNKLNKNVSYD